ncbi:MAG: DNA polymerase III subunit delta [Dehalococcoidia bacterium]
MLYILYGSDPVARREAFGKLKAGLDTDGGLATNTTHLEAAKTSPQEVIAACDTVPFLGEHRLVIVEGLLTWASKRAKKTAKDAKDGQDEEGEEEEAQPDPGRWELLLAYIPNMPPSTTLLLLDDGVPATTALLKKLTPLGDVKRFSAPGEKETAGWVRDYARANGFKIDGAACNLLGELIGPDTRALVSELDKLAAYAGTDTVRVDDVRELVGRAKEQKGYFLAEAVVKGRGVEAAKLLQELIDDGQVPPVLLSTIAGRYRRIAIAKDMMERRSGTAEIARRLATTETAVRFLMEAAEHVSWAAIRRAYDRFIEAELDLKHGLMDDRTALELAVQELALRPGRAA